MSLKALGISFIINEEEWIFPIKPRRMFILIGVASLIKE